MVTVHCARCGRPEAPALPRQPLPGKLGAEVRERACLDCWNEWQKMEVMVINELRLNFMDPAAQETLTRHMKEFLFPGEAKPGGESPLTPLK
ncbi:MAG: oxidative damage protection protein [Acidobacteria bacterium]|nr:oxidative damage protection protein [Acidobacteriota bacterium]